MDCEVRIYELETPDCSLLTGINNLLAQLSSTPVQFGYPELEAIVKSPASHLFVAECGGVLAGMLTLGEYLAPTGRKMWIEDVVVDKSMRGHSIGRKLVEHAIGFAKSLGSGTLMLTSRSTRVAANVLYQSCGFLIKETNLYRMPVDGDTV